MKQSTSDNMSLEALAVSFIADAIQTVNKGPNITPPHSSMDLKSGLLLKQQLLQQHISNSKLLMEKLKSAKTKAEKDQILARIRDHNR